MQSPGGFIYHRKFFVTLFDLDFSKYKKFCEDKETHGIGKLFEKEESFSSAINYGYIKYDCYNNI